MGQPVAGTSGQQDAGYAARMAASRLQYPCHGCGVHGHWKKDGECNPADVAAYMKKKMADQAKKDAEEEEAEDSGKNIYWLSSPHMLYTFPFHVILFSSNLSFSTFFVRFVFDYFCSRTCTGRQGHSVCRRVRSGHVVALADCIFVIDSSS
jgi:hypothetical protein